ncbi:Nn.00g072330.m01.CDS01 [Neocucurbitaria sp. VM-36]
MNRLSALPEELISRICRFLGRNIDEDDHYVYYGNKDFGALRLTCQRLYSATLYDASVRFRLRHIEIVFNYSSLVALLRLTNTKAFRHRIRTIHLIRDDGPKDFVPRNSSDLLQWGLENEEANNFARSPEAVYMLAQCLRNLRLSVDLETITYEGGVVDVIGQAAVLEAVIAAQLPRPVVRIPVDLEQIRQPGWGDLTDILGLYLPWVQDVSITAPRLECDLLDDDNESGYHIEEFRLDHPDLDRVLRAIRDVPDLTVIGCNQEPRLRLCHGCHDLFISNIAHNPFTHLSRFELSEIYISGSRLRRFITDHAATLRHFIVEYVKLTDGSWYKIAYVLGKFCQLSHLNLGGELYQKKRRYPYVRPRLPASYKDDEPSAFVWGESNVSYYLHRWERHFKVCRNPPGEPSRYVKVCIFNIPDVSRSITYQQLVVRNYALEYEG